MIQKKAIDEIYKRYRKRPESPDELNIPLLFEQLPPETDIEIDGNELVLGSVDASSPFHRLPIGNIHAIIEFSEAVAIVLPHSIVFLSKDDGQPYVHLKELKQSFLSRLKSAIG